MILFTIIDTSNLSHDFHQIVTKNTYSPLQSYAFYPLFSIENCTKIIIKIF
ncbi:hypothetical protein HMPREF3213_02070 [Heyndrickxia coagulans]|uniref:Uncharacterized protein n=1 Tax=Heyndrickxia coagulans TaxID=1398 RepID=A0A133KNI4_HEYCO|nr:hypothetical protein HMPREF3213_02070 [Heyndrickxia coagulans]